MGWEAVFTLTVLHVTGEGAATSLGINVFIGWHRDTITKEMVMVWEYGVEKAASDPLATCYTNTTLTLT